MKEYHKINTLWQRSPQGDIIPGQWALPEFEYLANNKWVFTEKVDGTNIRVMWDGVRIAFGGKTDNASIPQGVVNRLNEIFINPDVKKLFWDKFGDMPVCLYGEGYGAKIQKSGVQYKPTGQDFVLFDVLIAHNWQDRESISALADTLGLDKIPVVGSGTLLDALKLVEDGFNSKWGNFLAEGIVARPCVELKNRCGNRIIAKIKNRDFNKKISNHLECEARA